MTNINNRQYLNKMMGNAGAILVVILVIIQAFSNGKITEDEIKQIDNAITSLNGPSETPTLTQVQSTDNKELFKVVEIIDGDTIKVLPLGGATKQPITIRYIGIDAPEIHSPTKKNECFSAEAKRINSELALDKEVFLEKDKSDTDRYNRLLRYVYIWDETTQTEGPMVNTELIRLGAVKAKAYFPDTKYEKLFESLGREAKQHYTGLWACNL